MTWSLASVFRRQPLEMSETEGDAMQRVNSRWTSAPGYDFARVGKLEACLRMRVVDRSVLKELPRAGPY